MRIKRAPARFTMLIALAAMLGTLLAGCGYKGPLYLPDETSAPKKS